MNSQKVSFAKAVERFKQFLVIEKGCSENSALAYEKDLNQFWAWFVGNAEDGALKAGIPLEEITEFHLSSFLADMIVENDNSPRTRNRKLYALRSFYSFLCQKGLVDENLARSISPTKPKTGTKPVYLNIEQARKILTAARESDERYTKRNTAILSTLIYAGLRVSELTSLDIKNVDFDLPALNFTGKGNKERTVPLHAIAARDLKEYIAVREEPKKADGEPLFVSYHKGRLSARQTQKIVKRYAKSARIKNHREITPHKLRHTFASMFYRTTKDIKSLQELLGHSSILMTQIYTHTEVEDHARAINELPAL